MIQRLLSNFTARVRLFVNAESEFWKSGDHIAVCPSATIWPTTVDAIWIQQTSRDFAVGVRSFVVPSFFDQKIWRLGKIESDPKVQMGERRADENIANPGKYFLNELLVIGGKRK